MRTYTILFFVIFLFACKKEEEPKQKLSEVFEVYITDINGDGITDITDFIFYNSAFGTFCDGCPEDINGDGMVDIDDFLELQSDLSISDSADVTLFCMDLHTFAIGDSGTNTSEIRPYLSGTKHSDGSFYIAPLAAANSVRTRINTRHEIGYVLNEYGSYNFDIDPCDVTDYKWAHSNPNKMGRTTIRGHWAWPYCLGHPFHGHRGYDYDPFTSLQDSVHDVAIIEIIMDLEFNRPGFPPIWTDTCVASLVRLENGCAVTASGSINFTEPIFQDPFDQSIHTDTIPRTIPVLN